MLSEREANEGRSTFLIEILYRNFQSRGVACCFILSSFSIMKLPLDFQKFFVKNIQKIKNGLRIICCAPHHRRYAAEPPPKGKPRSAAFKWFVSENKLRPSSPRFARSFPPRGSLENRRTLKFQTVCNSPLRGTRRALIHYYVFQGGVFGKRGTAQFFPVEAAFERFVAQLFRFEYHLRAVFQIFNVR